MKQIPLDDRDLEFTVCTCEFTPYNAEDNPEDEESWHYLRRCKNCGCIWYSLHCPHDGHQHPCPECRICPLKIGVS